MKTAHFFLTVGLALLCIVACRSEKASQRSSETPPSALSVHARVARLRTGAPIHDFDLVASNPKDDSTDENGILFDAAWQFQTNHPGFPDASECSFAQTVSGVSLGDPPCTADPVTFDQGHGLHQVECSFSGGNGILHGHANWRLVTDTGIARWHDHSFPDQDYTLMFVPVKDGGLLKSNDGLLEVEFNSQETIDRFKNPWWVALRQMVYHDDRLLYDPPTNMDDLGHDHVLQVPQILPANRAILTGLFGIDLEHGAHAEIHPVYAMAIDVSPAESGEEDWAIFVRDRGHEGWCSQKLHDLTDLPEGRYTVALPWKPDASSVTVKAEWDKTPPTLREPSVRVVAGSRIDVQFDMSDSATPPMFDGLVRLTWKQSSATTLSARTQVLQPKFLQDERRRVAQLFSAAETSADLNEPERRISNILLKMDPKQRSRLFWQYRAWASQTLTASDQAASQARQGATSIAARGTTVSATSPPAEQSRRSPRVVDVEEDSTTLKQQHEGDLILCAAIISQEKKQSLPSDLVAACRTELRGH